MPELEFTVIGAEAERHAAAPTLSCKLAIRQAREAVPIQSISLQCQIRIEVQRRSYQPQEQERLSDLFGEPERWSETLRGMLWTHIHVTVPPFEGNCVVDLPVPCSFDFNLAATKYFHGLQHGEVPLLLLFSGSVFWRDTDGTLSMDLISWQKEARHRLPVQVWRNMMDMYYPDHNWLCLSRPVFEALYQYKRRQGCTGFDEALLSLLPAARRHAS
ncbi:MAG: DUF6084 family protein [Steroidobacteraceae bacterium]